MRLVLIALILCTASAADAQSLDIGAQDARTGLSIGNSPVWTGLRINWRDDGVQRLTGINLTLWTPRENPDFTMNGLAAGIVGPGVGTLNGIGVGLGGVMAERGINGVAIGGLGVVSQGGMTGASLAGLGIVSEGDMRGLKLAGLGVVSQGSLHGLTVAGLGVVSDGPMSGINVAGLGLVSQGSMTGMNIGGLATVAQGDMIGTNVGGLALVAEGEMRGINVGGLAVVTQGDMLGLNVGGLAVVGIESIRGVTASLGAVESTREIRGSTLGGYRVKAPYVEGFSAAVGMMRTEKLCGLSIAGYNNVRGLQVGIAIGVFNTADELNGIQIGLLNRAKNNRPPFQWLPILNAHFD